MATTTEIDTAAQKPSEYHKDTNVDSISQSLSKTNLQDDTTQSAGPQQEKTNAPTPPIIVYKRSHILSLHNSPLVRPPPNMPELKDWFGTDLDQNVKKDAEPSSSSARERRFRRDAEDGDARPSFRSAVSQPSQMGNFKHQSLRTNDREKERDRDADRERERDLRDREGQERLRHLSDKFDRDRMTLSGSAARGKERDGVPNVSSRLNSQAAATASRRTDGAKKRSGEVVEDWRRIGEPSRSGREEKVDNNRRDRDDRERPRSRIRDSSRTRAEVSATRRGRDEKEKREDNFRERSSRGDKDRDDRRERDRDLDKDSEHDDPRHWRDDGKRDERMARRDRENKERPRERDATLDPTNDRRWAADERDSRTKRSTKERKSLQGEDTKDREDRRDRERDRDKEKEKEKEKEPAWMDTYIPTGPGFGILGGKGANGELDGIQAWKKGMKEKEQREREKEQGLPLGGRQDEPSLDNNVSEKADTADKQLDEIQLFKLLMKREEEKRKTDSSVPLEPADLSNLPNGVDAVIVAGIHSDSIKDSLEQDQHILLDPLKGVSAHADASPDESTNLLKASSSRYITPEHAQIVEKVEPVTTYNPPSASRLLSLGRPPNSTNPNALDPLYGQFAGKPESAHGTPGFSPFGEQNRHLSLEDTANNDSDSLRRSHIERASSNIDASLESTAFEINPGHPGSRGSRFAKFFDNKSREPSAPVPKPQTPVGQVSSSPHPGQQYESFNGSANEPRTLEDIFAMLSNSSQGHRSVVNPPMSQQAQNNLHLLQQAAYQQQSQQLQTNQRLEPLYESRLEDRNFVPDGMVPGLRTVPQTRNRDYSEGLEDIMHHNIHRSAQQRLEPMYPAPPPMFNPQRNAGIPIQQAHFRGGPSPISGQQGPLQPSQRLPPGLANLGGRPPHDPSQFLNMSGVPNPTLHAAVSLSGPSQQTYNTFTPNSGLNFGGPPYRNPLPTHQLQNSLNHHTIGALGAQNNLNPSQAQFLAMNGIGMGGLRNLNSGLGPQQAQSSQLHNPLASVRQQQQPLHPHTLPHMLPHLPQQGLASQTNQPAHDLMALLMGGPHRE